MKPFLILIVLFFSTQAEALIFEVVDRKGATLLLSEKDVTIPNNVGQVTVDFLTGAAVSFLGDIGGISSMFNLENDIEVISDREMKAWGWCFAIDGKVPETMADETPVFLQASKIYWYYAFAHYKDGAWIGQCVKERDLDEPGVRL